MHSVLLLYQFSNTDKYPIVLDGAVFTVQKLFFKVVTFVQQGCIKLIKSDGKDIYNVTI